MSRQSGIKKPLSCVRAQKRGLYNIIMCYYYLSIADNLFLILPTYASIVATATIFTTSRTLAPKSIKWIGLFSPIWIGPMISASLPSICSILYEERADVRLGNTSVFTFLPLRRVNGYCSSRSSSSSAKLSNISPSIGRSGYS